MSISSSATRKAGPFAGVGSTGPFPFTYKVFASTDVLVVQTSALGVETTLTLTTHYTVSLNANQDANPGGSVTLVTALPVGETLTLGSQVSSLQPVVLTNGGGWYPAVLNDALDRLTIIAQQVQEVVGRSFRLPFSSSGVSVAIPTPSANKALKWNAGGTALVNSTNDVDTAEAAAAASAATATTQAGLATAAKNAADADVVLTHADVVLTHADVVLTHADVVTTGNDVTTAAGHKNAAAASAAAAAASAAALVRQYAEDTGTADAKTATYPNASPTLVDGYALSLHINATNATTTPTFAPTTGGVAQTARTIVRIINNAAAAVVAGDLQGIAELVYDLPNTRWILQNPPLTGSASQDFAVRDLSAARVINGTKGADIASAATINLTTATGNLVHVTGTTTITAVTLGSGMEREVIFDGALTLTHHSANCNLPGAANILTAAGDRATFYSDGTTVYCTKFVRASSQPFLQSGAAVATTSGTFFDLSPPVGVKRVIVMLKTVSLSGTAMGRVQLGTGGAPETSGYVGEYGYIYMPTPTSNTFALSSGFDLYSPSAAMSWTGRLELNLLDAATNTWECLFDAGGASYRCLTYGTKSLAGALNLIRLTSSNGTDTFDLGSANYLFE